MKAVAAVAACALSLLASSAMAQAVVRHALPPEVTFPEGVAYDAKAGVLYAGSAYDGAVARLDPRTGRSEVLVKGGVLVKPEGPFPRLLGMKLDDAGRLWIGGGRTGRIFVVDTRTGAVVANLETKAPGSGVINDLVLTPSGGFFTDTFRPVLWRVDTSRATPGQPEPWLDLSTGPIQYGDQPNLNGIAATPDGKGLIVVQMAKGLLFHIDIATKRITPIDLKGQTVPTADGLVLDGRTLYAVGQGAGEITTIELAPDYRSGEVKARLKEPALQMPATAALAGDRLYVVNTQFNKRETGDAQRPFQILEFPVARLKP